MKKLVFFVAVCIMFSSSAFAFDMKSHCKKVADAGGGSYQIEEMCLKQEQESKAELEKMTVPERIEKHCKEVAEAGGGSYQIMLICVKQEIESKSRLENK